MEHEVSCFQRGKKSKWIGLRITGKMKIDFIFELTSISISSIFLYCCDWMIFQCSILLIIYPIYSKFEILAAGPIKDHNSCDKGRTGRMILLTNRQTQVHNVSWKRVPSKGPVKTVSAFDEFSIDKFLEQLLRRFKQVFLHQLLNCPWIIIKVERLSNQVWIGSNSSSNIHTTFPLFLKVLDHFV